MGVTKDEKYVRAHWERATVAVSGQVMLGPFGPYAGWLRAAEVTRLRLQAADMVEEELYLLQQMSTLLVFAPAEYAAYGRILSRQQRALDELKWGMKR